MGGFSTVGGGGATPADIWAYPTRTLTEYGRTAYIIKNKAYTQARVEDLLYANAARMGGLVTMSELASFIDYGVANLGNQDVWAEIFTSNPLSLWPTGDLTKILNDAGLTAASIAEIIRSGYMPADKAQEILYAMIDSGYYDKLLNLLTFDASDESLTAATTYTAGVNRRRSLSIASGVTLTLGAAPSVIIADTISNSGTITTSVAIAGGARGASGAGAGGVGRGGIILIARTITIGTITADGGAGGAGGIATGNGAGGAGTAGLFWVRSGDTVPSGGQGGHVGGLGYPNAGGGGSSASIYGGSAGNASVISFATGQALAREILKCAVDWWLVNVVGKTPTAVKSFPNLGGSGGGGGAAQEGSGGCGGGGGGGGEIIVVGVNVTAGTLNANAGAGGRGGSSDAYDSGGGGGGGGVCYVFYVSLTGTNTFNVAGGAGGGGDYSGAAGGAGFGVAVAI